MGIKGSALEIRFLGNAPIMQPITNPKLLDLKKAWLSIANKKAPNKTITSVRLIEWKETKKLFSGRYDPNKVVL